MPEPYRVALGLVRLYAAINLYSAVFLLLACVLGVALMMATGTIELASYVLSLAMYVVIYVASGIAMWVFSKPIARFAAKAFAP